MMSMQGYQSGPGVSATVRAISDQERQALGSVLRPLKANAIGMALVSMIMAVMVNFVTDEWLVVVPIFFGVAALGIAVQTRKMGGKVATALMKGTVTDVRSPAVRKGRGGSWDFGLFSLPRSGSLNSLLVEGSPAQVTIVPETRHLLSVNFAPMKKPIPFFAAPGFEGLLMAYSAPADTQRAVQTSVNQELPPPPDDWGARYCSKCGASLVAGAAFCGKCGSRQNQ